MKRNKKIGLYVRGGAYWMRFTVGGKQYRRSTGTGDPKIAQQIYDILRGEIALGKWKPEEAEPEKEPEYTFNELAERYCAWADGRQRSAAWKGYLIKQLKERFNEMLLCNFDTHVLETFQAERIKKGNKPATANRFTAVLSHMFTKATDWKMMDKATVADINVVMFPENNKRLRYLSIEEAQLLVKCCESYLAPIVITALNTGMRKSEILNLRWDAHIDLKHGFILLDITKNGERREIPINATLRATLQGITRRLDVPYVFCNPVTGKPYQKDFKKSFHSALRKAKIADFRFHDLRHTFASHLIMAGIDLTTVKELLGHKDIKMTLRYSHLAPAHKASAVDIYDQKMNPKTVNLAQI